MTKTANLDDRLQEGFRDKSIIKDLNQGGVSTVFSEESKRNFFEKKKRDGQHRAARTWRNSQNNSVSHLLEAFQRRDTFLRMR